MLEILLSENKHKSLLFIFLFNNFNINLNRYFNYLIKLANKTKGVGC